MSNNPSVNEDMAARVRAAAKELGYQPSASAKGLASGKTSTVGVVVPNLANPYFADVIKSVTLEANAANYRILISDSNEDEGREADLTSAMQRDCDGVILVSPRMDSGALRVLSRHRTPLVMVNRAEPGIAVPSVSVDNYTAMMAMMAHLMKLGHKRICYLAGPALAWQEQERLRAVRQAETFGAQVAVVEAGGTSDAGYKAVPAALKTNSTALACFNDLVAFGALARLNEEGISVPGDMSLTGFDDIPFAKYCDPSLTTASSPQGDLGRLAWQLMADRLSSGETANAEPLEAPIVVRASTAAPRA